MKELSLERVSGERSRELLDFFVSGKSILAELERRGFELVPRSRSGSVPLDQKTRAHLLLEQGDELSSGRVALYTCSCGDYGCGVVSVSIHIEKEQVIWSDFRFENNYDDEFTSLERLGPFRFSEKTYRDTIIGAGTSS